MTSSSAPAPALKPTLSVADVVAITVSSVTPASSVFVIAPFAIAQAGTGVIWAFMLGGVLALMFALCYAELGRAHSAAGGEYVFAKRVFGGMAGYATFLTALAMLVFIPPVLATGAATYLNAALGTQLDGQAVALVIVTLGYLLAILNIKLNAWVTGICLLLEVAALMVIVVLGFGHAQQPVSSLVSPLVLDNGMLHAAPWALVVGAIGTALFSFNGYGGAVLLAEDMKCGGRGIPKAVLWSLVLLVAIEVIPLVALLIGAPSLAELTSFTVLLILCVYLVVGLCALFSRVLRRDREHPYRMPLWPLPALVAVTGAGYLLTTLLAAASARDIFIIVGILLVSGLLYGTYGKLSPAFQKL
ncbi:amino acid permease [Pseudomonas sp. NPDC008258]|uniref:APC family permease n=1 Tax=Pseudomonas sp. NPDC008258 TaxID=3364418 RepID=UPI0036E9DE6E